MADGQDGYTLQTPELWGCAECGREFVDEESLRLHSGLHEAAGEAFTQTEILLRRDLLYKEVRRQEDEASERQTLIDQSPTKQRRIYRPHSKRVGLTKIRLEDCLRCDACSCIYIDERDYYKHMRNFHQKYNTVIPRSRRKSPHQHKCSVSYTRVHTQEQPSQAKRIVRMADFPLAPPIIKQEQNVQLNTFQPPDGSFFKEKIKAHFAPEMFEQNRADGKWKLKANAVPTIFAHIPPKKQRKPPLKRDSPKKKTIAEEASAEPVIDSRWSKVSERLSSQVKIKQEPLDDMDYFLSQVEVKIKTEPPEI